MKQLFTLFLISCFGFSNVIVAQKVSGELKTWHKVTVTFDGPNTNENANPNPFTDYRLDVTFKNGSKTYVVPGYYAACDNPAEGCTSGNKWKVNFAPDRTGTWTYTASFKTGKDVAVNGGGAGAGFMDGKSGNFSIASSNKNGRDFRAANKGRLQYVGEHYLRFSGSNPDNPNGPWFVKAGADSPENAFNYNDFDYTPNFKNNLNKVGNKTWQPHQRDYNAGDAGAYTWQNGKGSEMLGMINYLSSEGANVMSFLTWNADGDGGAIFPHLSKIAISEYAKKSRGQQWNSLHKDRFDVSKTAQWEKIMEYADKKGIYLHFKTMETENDNKMDGNKFGRERKIYYRELIARFGHHLALNWNLTEETTLPDNVVRQTATYIKNVDPYDHNIVIHTYPQQQNQRYNPLLGNKSDLTGASVQTDKRNVHNDIRRWIEASAKAGKKWVVANDEQGNAGQGIRVNDKQIRKEVLWGALMAGGAGVEYYYGYTNTDGDINNQNHRLRGNAYKQAGYGIKFFEQYFQKYMLGAKSNDGLTNNTNDYVLANNGNAYAVYLPDGGNTTINIPNKTWKIQWYNPRNGAMGQVSNLSGKNINAPDNNDWIALITSDGATVNPTPTPTPTPATSQAIPGKIEAESFNSQNGIQSENTSDNGGGQNIGFIENGDNAVYAIKVAKNGTYQVTARVASATNGGKILINADGKKVGEITVAGTNGWQTWTSVTADVQLTTAAKEITLQFTGGAGYLFNVNYVDFTEKTGGATSPTPKPTPAPSTPTTGCADFTFEEKNGVVAVEAEHFVKQSKTSKREWFVIGDNKIKTPTPDPDPSHADSASGKQYVELLPDTRVTHSDPLVAGVSFSNKPGEVAILDYKINFNSPGKYFVWVRANSTGSEDNGIHVGIDGTWPESGARMQWCAGKNQWTWESKQRTAANHCGEAQKIFLNIPSAGVHTISFSMREDGFEMDKFVLSKAYTKPSGNGANEIAFNCPDKPTPTPVPNKAPKVSFAEPLNNSKFKAGQFFPVSVSATDSDGTISEITFDLNGKIITDKAAPFSTTFMQLEKGTYTLKATAKDNDGATASATVTVIIEEEVVAPTPTPAPTPQENKKPSVSFVTPIKDISVKEGEAFTMEANATDSDGKIVNVLFQIDGKTLVTERFLPYTGKITLDTAGTYTLTALTKDDKGATATASLKVTVTKKQAAIVSKTVTLSPIHDAYLQGNKRYNNTILRVENNKRTSYFMFDISKIKGTVTAANFKLTVASDPGNGLVEVFQGTSNNWTETNLSANNAAAKGTKLGSLNKAFALNSTEDFKLSKLSVNGNMLTLVVTQNSGNDVAFASKENATGQPQLNITYNENVGAKDANANKINVVAYPNPTVNAVTIEGDDSLIGSTLDVVSLNGVLLTAEKINATSHNVDLSNYAKGAYLFMIKKDNHSITIVKIVKQ